MRNKDYIWLALIQGANALLPLILFPFLYKTVPSEIFAEIVLAEVIAFYVLAISLYSFDITGVNRWHSGASKKKIFLSILYLRLMLFSLASIFCLTVTYLWFNANVVVVAVWLFFPVGMILQGNFACQAEGDSRALSVIILLSRLLVTTVCITIVDGDSSALLISYIICTGYLISGFCSFLVQINKFGGVCQKLKREEIYLLIKDDFYVFVGNASVTLFRNSNIAILGAVASPRLIAAYATAEKVVRSTQAFIRPLNQYYQARLAKSYYSKGGVINASIIWGHTKVQIFTVFLVSTSIFLVCFFIEFEGKFNEVAKIISVMIFASCFGVLNFMYGSVGLVLSGEKYFFAKSVIKVGILNLAILPCCYYLMGEDGAAFAFLLAEVVLFTFIFYKYSAKERTYV